MNTNKGGQIKCQIKTTIEWAVLMKNTEKN